jgi:hypothetical protein
MSLSIRPLIHLLHIICASLLALLLSGCSALQIGYNSAPRLSYWWLDSYLDFTATQSPKIQSDLAALHDWHRQNELPTYALLLAKWQRLAPSAVSPEQVCGLWSEVRDSLQRLSEQAQPSAAAIAPTLKNEQLEHLAKKFEKRNKKWREEWIDGSLSERQARRLELSVERAEMLYGSLDEAQLAVIRRTIAASSFDPLLSYREFQRRQQDALLTLKALQTGSQSELQAKIEIQGLFDRLLNSPDAAYQRYLVTQQAQNCKAISELHNSTSRAQRHKAMDKLKDYESLALKLAAERR